MKFLSTFIFLIFFILNLHANQKEANILSSIVSNDLFELDTNSMKRSLVPYLKEKTYIKTLKIIDLGDSSTIFTYERTENTFLINTKLSKCTQNQKFYSSNIVYDTDIIGILEICTTTQLNQINFTKKELNWLQKHPIVSVHNEKNWAPFNFNKNGLPSGLSIDYMNLLASKIGLKVKYITGEWNELYNKAINKKLDILLNIARTKKREKLLLFTDQYQNNKAGIFSRKKDSSIIDIESLNGRKVAIVESFIHEDILKNKYPLIQRVITKNIPETIKALENGSVDAIIGSYMATNYIARELLINNIELKAPFYLEDGKQLNLHIAVRNDYPLLHSILQKAMSKVTSQEINEIRRASCRERV